MTSQDPATPSYVTETLGILGDQDPLEILATTPRWITDHIDNLPESALAIPEGPGKWSITQVLAHLADTELAFGWRVRMILTEDRPLLQAFNETRWAERFDYASADPVEAWHAFAMLRTWNLRIWDSLTPEDLARVGVHEQRGEESLDFLRRFVAGHDLRHRRQISRILDTEI